MKDKRFNPELVSVFVKDGHHFLVTPCGHEIKGLTSTMVSDSVDMPATVSADMFVNLVSTKEEAMEKYKTDCDKCKSVTVDMKIDGSRIYIK